MLWSTELPVEFVTPLHDTEVSQKATAVLDCEVSKPDAKATWYKNGEPITVQDGYDIRVDKTHHSLFLEKVSLDDTAEYKIVIQDKSSQAKFTVKGEIIERKKDRQADRQADRQRAWQANTHTHNITHR